MTQTLELKNAPRLQRRFLIPTIVAFVVAALVAGWALTRADKVNPDPNAPSLGAPGAATAPR